MTTSPDSISTRIAASLEARGAPPLTDPFTDAEWAVLAQFGKPAVDLELTRLERRLQDDGFYRSGFTKGLFPPVDPFEGCDREEAP
jgi:hypothetical protein